MSLPIFADGAGIGVWTVAAVVVLALLSKLILSSSSKNLPPGPRAFPIVGGLPLLGKHPYKDLAKFAKTYGPVMTFWFGQKRAVIVSSPAAAEEVYKTQGLNFSSRPLSSFGEVVLNTADIAMGPETPTSIHLKKMLHIHLSTTKQLKESQSVRSEEIDHLLRVIPQDGTTVVPVRTYVEVVVSNILCRMILKKRMMAVAGAEDEIEEVRKFRELADEVHLSVVHKGLGDFIPIFKYIDIQGHYARLRKLKRKMDAFASLIVSEHLMQRKNNTLYKKDMVDVLLDQMEDKTLKVNITYENVYGVLWNALVAGTSTSIEAVEWTLAECIRNPHVMSKVQAELDNVVGRSRRVEDADLPNLKYLTATIKETFRLHLLPMVLPRQNLTACKVYGYDIPAGTMLMVNARAIARDPNIFESPLEFKPERFLEGMPHATTDVQGHTFEILPFGSGRRACPGMTLAINMVHIQTATLLQCFDWSLPDGLPNQELDMTEAEGMVPYKAQPLSAIPKPRLSIPLCDKL